MVLQLTRFPLSAMVAASALAGYALYPGAESSLRAGFLGAGVFLLAAGCSALNQVQERGTDALMVRTRNRPIPSRRLSPRSAAAIAALLIAAGLGLLVPAGPLSVAGLGLFTLLWYNGLYTGLKKVTSAAALPGALCGAIPPMMGWIAAGGDPLDYRILLLSGVFFLWQLPHFWLFALKFREDFTRAGFPPPFPSLHDRALQRIILAWIASLAAGTLMLGAFGLVQGIPAMAFCLGIVVWIAGCTARELLRGGTGLLQGRIYFRLNLFMGMVIGLILIDALLPGSPF